MYRGFDPCPYTFFYHFNRTKNEVRLKNRLIIDVQVHKLNFLKSKGTKNFHEKPYFFKLTRYDPISSKSLDFSQ